MRMKLWLLTLINYQVTLWLVGASAFAQGVVLQQPVVDVFRVDTAVSVPDRGSLLLGGVSSARDVRQSYGPLPYGSSLGRALTHSTASVHVYVHDFELLDHQLLLQAEHRLGFAHSPESTSSPRRQLASEILKRQSPRDFSPRQVHAPATAGDRRATALEILRRAR